MFTFQKANAEEITLAFDYKTRLGIANSLISATLTAIDTSDNSSATGTILSSSTATISGTQAQFRVIAGTAGRRYRITQLATMDNADIFEEQLDLVIR